MKHITTLGAVLMLLCVTTIQAQPVLYGLTEFGGNSAGAISRLDAANNTLSTVFAYPNDGISPSLQSSPVQLPNGKVYGMTNRGGKYNGGTIYTINPDGTGFQKLHDFDGLQGADPRGTLFLASNGFLYGMTLGGGATNQGTVFRFDPVSATFTHLLDFLDAPGSQGGQAPFGSFTEYDGRLFGLLSVGGANNQGSIFSIDLAGGNFTKHHDFINNATQSLGSNPYNSLLLASDGLMYGMTYGGGQYNGGVIFSFDPVTKAFTKRFDLGTTSPVFTGKNPFGSLIQDPGSGLLYGATFLGGNHNNGTVFSFQTTTNSLTVIHHMRNFSPDFEGRGPGGTLALSASGTLYGLASGGGTIGKGTVFKLDVNGSNFTVLRQLLPADGQVPYGSPLLLSNGNLMVTPGQTGDGFNGTIAILSGGGTTYTKVHDFNLSQGAYPRGSLFEGKDRILYGMTNGGGDFGQGILFGFNPGSTTINRLHSFQNNTVNRNGANPQGSLAQTPDGTLWGMTFEGGSGNQGVLFSINPDGSGYTKKVEFAGANGARPIGGLLLGQNGLLYGVTSKGGSSELGIVFSYNPSAGAFSMLHVFNGTNGSNPRGNLVQTASGMIYGMTFDGGANNQGVIFSLNPLSNAFTLLYQFNYSGSNTGAAKPSGKLTEGADGLLYGMSEAGGSQNQGAIFSFDPSNGQYNTLVSFDNALLQGRNPLGSLTLGSDRRFYGMTSAGGAYERGTIFSFNPTGSVFTKLQDFNLDNGASPRYSDWIEPGRCRPPQIVCPANMVVTTAPTTCSANVSFSAGLTDFCPATIRYYLNYGSANQLEISSGQNFAVGVHTVTAVASNQLGEQSTCIFTITVRSGTEEICGNQIDDDCDGLVDETCTPRLFIADTTVLESTGLARVRVSLLGTTDKVVSTRYVSQEKSAKSPQDFTAVSGQLVFQPGETQKYIPVQISIDQQKEKSEQFDLRLNGAINAIYVAESGAPGKATVTIRDENPALLSGSSLTSQQIIQDQRDAAESDLVLSTRALPNPSTGQFQCTILSSKNLPVEVRVTDVQGRVIDHRRLGSGERKFTLGERWNSGSYIVEISQGDERRLIRLIKY